MKNIILILFLVLFFNGCVIIGPTQTVYRVPNSSLPKKEAFFVKSTHEDKFNIKSIIERSLIQNGINVVGSVEDADVILTYDDRWIWDFKTYLALFKIQLRNAKDEYPAIILNKASISSGQSADVIVSDAVNYLLTNGGKQ